MTDRELLEAAAKAAGIDGGYGHLAGQTGIIVMKNSGSRLWTGKIWNPLMDDGDALRLAVQLKVDVMCARGNVVVRHRKNRICPPTIHHRTEDACADTRRAIVRAAAAIGKEMK
jgi:hypothetical protein